MARSGKRRRKPPHLRRGNDPHLHLREMRASFPTFIPRFGRDRTVTWRGTFQPNPSSDSYLIEIVYRSWGHPKVFVLDPPVPANAPHRWPDGSLCLFWPKNWRWSDSESISGTIMIWAALWLEYYEIWTAVDIWLGPSSHQEFPEENDDD